MWILLLAPFVAFGVPNVRKEYLGASFKPITPFSSYGTGASPVGCLLSDFDNDSILDLVSVNIGAASISLLKGNGDGTFNDKEDFAVGNTPRLAASGRINGDAFNDLVVGNIQDNTVSVLINNGTGGFEEQVTFLVGAAPQGVALGDFDGDGDTDVAVANYVINNVAILLNTGLSGTSMFAPPVFYGCGGSPTGIKAVDVNKDGNLGKCEPFIDFSFKSFL